MKKIIVPTDFSTAANEAVQYATQLAFFFKCDVELVHVLNPATDLNTGYMIDPGIETVKRKKLKALTEEVSKQIAETLPSEISVMSSFYLGFPIEEIINLSKSQDSLIVVGATGESGVMGRVFGSIPSHLARRAHAPVLIIPKGVKFSVYKEIAYASAEANLDHAISKMIKQFVMVFNARLHCVHIGKDEQYPEWQMEAIFGNNQNNGTPELIKKNLDRVDVVSALNHYCDENDVDMLIMATKHRRFWDSIIHTSMTREMALDPHLPLLVFHDRDKL